MSDHGSELDLDLSIVRRITEDHDLAAVFAEAAATAGMGVRRCRAATVADAIGAVLGEAAPGAARAVVGIADDDLRRAAAHAIERTGAISVAWRDTPGLDALYDATVGIIDVDVAVAETGSLVIDSGASRSRGTHLLPEVLVALVPAARILADLVDLLSSGAAPMPAARTMVTGPSKTADIEGVLVTGVHGPGRVEVIVIDA